MQDTTNATTQAETKRYQCRHILASGRRCQSPSLRGGDLCYFHHRSRVAHVQPVTRGEIEAIRGVNSDSVVSTLLDRGLIAEAGRKDVVGRPMQYRTTPFFLESFGLRSLDDLPDIELEPGQPLELKLLEENGS